MRSRKLGIDNPLPQRYLTPDEGIGGVIKKRPEDFLVEELPLYDPCGEGEHLYLGIEKKRVSHGELLSCLRRHFKVKQGDIGYAGMKDKIAITRQTVSIHLPGREVQDVQPDHERINVLWAKRHRNKIRRGHLHGNRFSIRVRRVDPLAIREVRRRLEVLATSGIPNYYGSQRFGYRSNNHRLGALQLWEQWRDLLEELLGSTGSSFPKYQWPARELFDNADYKQAQTLWTAANSNELSAVRALAHERTDAQACEAVGHPALSFWISALQSAIFNRVIDRRTDEGSLMTLLEGDLAWKHDSRAVFVVTAQELATAELGERLKALEISPSGPMWGPGMTRAAGHVAELENEVLAEAGLTPEDFEPLRGGLAGARRSLRIPVTNIEVESGVDDAGDYIRMAFDLPRGAYATVLLREIMKMPEDPPENFHTDHVEQATS